MEKLERIDRKYIWNEIVSVLNFEKGIFYTIKELLLRPGNTVREFLLYDRKRLVKPLIFVIFSSLIFIVTQNIFGFETGTAPNNINSAGTMQAFKWVGENFGIVNILLGLFIGFWTKVFFFKADYNVYEIFILIFFLIGFGNLIFTFFGIFESISGFEVNNWAYFVALIYSSWAIGNFFNKYKFSCYLRGLLAYLFGTSTVSILIFIVGGLIDVFTKTT